MSDDLSSFLRRMAKTWDQGRDAEGGPDDLIMAADAIERLRAETVSAEITNENLRAEIERLRDALALQGQPVDHVDDSPVEGGDR